MKREVMLILLVLILQLVSALPIISEVELNPEGTDAGSEWIELYCKEEISLDGYKIINIDDKELLLSGSCDGYFVYVFGKQWLDNKDEKVSLYKDSKLIDKTELLEDGKNNNFTWSYCNSWEFKEGTKGFENCKQEKIEEEETNESITDTTQEIEEKINESVFEEPSKLEVIKLNPTGKNIKTEFGKEKTGSSYAIYGLVIFCILLLVLFFLKLRKGKYKNEFE